MFQRCRLIREENEKEHQEDVREEDEEEDKEDFRERFKEIYVKKDKRFHYMNMMVSNPFEEGSPQYPKCCV